MFEKEKKKKGNVNKKENIQKKKGIVNMDDINQRQHPHPTVEYLLLSNDFGYYSLNVSEIRRNFLEIFISEIFMQLQVENLEVEKTIFLLAEKLGL